MKEYDEGLRKGELELKERDELEDFFKGADAELTSEPQFPKQQQALKRSQQMLKEERQSHHHARS